VIARTAKRFGSLYVRDQASGFLLVYSISTKCMRRKALRLQTLSELNWLMGSIVSHIVRDSGAGVTVDSPVNGPAAVRRNVDRIERCRSADEQRLSLVRRKSRSRPVRE